ncbi:MAG: PilZ domain-containing protein [Desulfobacterales bacterium]|nr:PilZ domain-containing protein [Desulfobacterales bacterium]MDJ0876156.1 PilZ domain-containing protein [Desulfobacterales bacterium]MDJ0883775.1 PilZ domain-containing protein [Desulfobacterales bacterium]
MQRVFISSDNSVTFTCPRCKKMRTVNITDYAGLDKAVKVRVRCGCGHRYPATIEKRRQFRREVAFPGTYTRLVNGRVMGSGTMVVKDVSRTGLKIRVPDAHRLNSGDTLEVIFHLDDPKKSQIQKEVVIRKIEGVDLGVQFLSLETGNPSDKAIGFYLM